MACMIRVFSLLIVVLLLTTTSCVDKRKKYIEEILYTTILEHNKGKLKRKIATEVGYPIKIKKVIINRIYKQAYNYQAKVIFAEDKNAGNPDLAISQKSDPFVKREPFIRYFWFLELEERWIYKGDLDKKPVTTQTLNFEKSLKKSNKKGK